MLRCVTEFRAGREFLGSGIELVLLQRCESNPGEFCEGHDDDDVSSDRFVCVYVFGVVRAAGTLLLVIQRSKDADKPAMPLPLMLGSSPDRRDPSSPERLVNDFDDVDVDNGDG